MFQLFCTPPKPKTTFWPSQSETHKWRTIHVLFIHRPKFDHPHHKVDYCSVVKTTTTFYHKLTIHSRPQWQIDDTLTSPRMTQQANATTTKKKPQNAPGTIKAPEECTRRALESPRTKTREGRWMRPNSSESADRRHKHRTPSNAAKSRQSRQTLPNNIRNAHQKRAPETRARNARKKRAPETRARNARQKREQETRARNARQKRAQRR